jgi:hypothetical protein
MTNIKMEIKRPSDAGLEHAFTIVAYTSLNENNESVDIENVEAESARIERCVEHYYKIDRNCDLDYPQFAAKFLQENFRDIVYSDKYIDDFLDGVADNTKENLVHVDM